MHILFTTQIAASGIGIVRAKWPARWVNKYSSHTAVAMDESDLLYSDLADILRPFDLVVVHKSSAVLLRVAMEAHRLGKKVIYDSDDHDGALYDKYRLLGYLQGTIGYRDQICQYADAITVTSAPLARALSHYGKPIAVIDNGYDTNLSEYQITNYGYFTGIDGEEWVKILYGGSTGHARDIAMLLDMGVIEALSDLPVDWEFVGVLEGPERTRKVGRSTVTFKPGKEIDSYIQTFYSDASVQIAPLVVDEFNHCRSTIKLQEAGLAGIPVVASNIESYRNWSDGVTLVENTKEQWVDALRELIISKETRLERGRTNKQAVYARHTAEHITKERMEFYENL